MDMVEIQIEESVQKALKILRPRYRWVLMCRFGIGGFSPMTMDEIAEILGTTRGYIWYLSTRAIEEFKLVYRFN